VSPRFVVVAFVVALAAPAHAQGPSMRGAAGNIEEAQGALASGDYARAALLAEAVVGEQRRSTSDRAEGYRVLGLARFFLGDRIGAKSAFLGYVRLEPEAHLDPALVPPEAIVILEEVRAERAAELAAARPRPKRKRALNLLPPFGQFQNQQPEKGFIVGGLLVSLLVTNVTTWAVLQSWCQDDQTCPGHQDSAEVLRTVNLAAAAGLAVVYGYGVVDGFSVMQQLERREAISVAVVPADEGLSLVLGAHF